MILAKIHGCTRSERVISCYTVLIDVIRDSALITGLNLQKTTLVQYIHSVLQTDSEKKVVVDVRFFNIFCIVFAVFLIGTQYSASS